MCAKAVLLFSSEHTRACILVFSSARINYSHVTAAIGGTDIAVQAAIISGQRVFFGFDLAGRFNLLRHVSMNFHANGRRRAIKLGAITQCSRDFRVCKLFDKSVKRNKTAI